MCCYCSIITSDPGFVTNGFASSDQVAEGSVSEVHNHEKVGDFELGFHLF